jgi:hypothetical protein
MIKIMQMEVLNVAVLTRPKRPAVKINNGICLRDPRASHGVVTIHSQVASQATGVVNVQNADMAMN